MQRGHRIDDVRVCRVNNDCVDGSTGLDRVPIAHFKKCFSAIGGFENVRPFEVEVDIGINRVMH